MALKIYNTFTRTKDEFIPLNGDRVNFYACGPTVYDYFHIGNARPLIMFDVFRRYLEYKGFDVNYIVNITDIDDKIIRRANEEGIDFKAVTRKYTDAFFDGCDKLGVRSATHHPRATEFIGEMQNLVQTLIDKGHAYVTDGDVYFDISSFPGYGKLSGRDIEQMQAGARVDVDGRKKNPLDFALWKAAKPDEPSWDSPWGPGRPGWHIECSVMGLWLSNDEYTKYKTVDSLPVKSLDIHAGGQDLIFPHHENEVAQSEAATEAPFARYWMHNGFLDIEGEKMSKSLGNFLMVKDILKQYDPMAVRIFFLLKHYRSPIDFSEERIREAKAAYDRLRNAYIKINNIIEKNINNNSIELKIDRGHHTSVDYDQVISNHKQIEVSLDDDFNTAKAIGFIFWTAKIINTVNENENTPNILMIVQEAKKTFDVYGKDIFGINFSKTLHTDDKFKNLMDLLIDIRENARKDKNWALADTIRNRLNDIGIALEDRQDGTSWKFI